VISEAVRWLEKEFDGHRVVDTDAIEYEPPREADYTYTRPLLEFRDDSCPGGKGCVWFVALDPHPDASIMLLGLPWTEAQEREWLVCGEVHDTDYLVRYQTYHKQGKEM
jgi:hypothetical protein